MAQLNPNQIIQPAVFQIQSSSMPVSALQVDSEGNTVVNKLVLVDEKTGSKWQIKIYDGNLTAEPLSLEDKRNFKIDKLLKHEI